MRARPYQSEIVNSALAAYASGKQSMLAAMPTGAGKTVVAGLLADKMLPSGRVMVLCHRHELIKQAAEKFERITGIAAAIEKAEEEVDENGLHDKPRIVVASVQSLNSETHKSKDEHKAADEKRRRFMKFDPSEFSFLWVDEGHHISASTFLRPYKWFTGGNPDLKALVVTATPDRADEQNIMLHIDGVAGNLTLPQMIKWGYLVPIKQRRIRINGLDFSKISKNGDDLNEKELEQVMLQEKPFHGCVHATIEAACGLSPGTINGIMNLPLEELRRRLKEMIGEHGIATTLCFSPGVEHSKKIAEILNRWMPGSAEHIDGDTDPVDRENILKRYEAGQFPFLCNCMVFTEGFDVARVQIVSVMRPTSSRPLYAQMIGRGTRPTAQLAARLDAFPDDNARRDAIANSDKPNMIVLDFVGNSGKHKLVCAIDLIAAALEEEDETIIEAAKEIAAEKQVGVDEALDEARQSVAQTRELERAMDELEQSEIEQAAEQRHLLNIKQRERVLAVASYTAEKIDPFDRYAASPEQSQGATHGGATDGQIKFLQKFGVRTETAMGYSKRQAAAVIDSYKKKKCTEQQSWRLKKMGYSDSDIAQINFDRASEIIEQGKGAAA